MKIYAIILTIVCSIHVLNAFEGFYVGGELGGALTEGRGQGESVGNFATVVFVPLNLEQISTHSSFQGALFAGYGTFWRALYLGGEVFTQFNSCKMKTDTLGGISTDFPAGDFTSTHTRIDVDTVQYGLDFRPGWAVTPLILLYGRVGVAGTHLKLKSDSSFTLINGTEVGLLPLELSSHQTNATLRLGGGVENLLTPHLAVRLDYIFSDYGTIKIRGAAVGATNIGISLGLNNQTEVRLQQHAVMFGLSYFYSRPYSYYCLPTCRESFFRGFYLGGALGGFYADDKNQESAVGFFPALTDLTEALSASPHLTNINFQGKLFGGYGLQWQRLFLGAEIFGEGSVRNSLKRTDVSFFDNTAISQELISLTTHLSVAPLQGGIDFRPGVCVTPLTLLYARVGTSIATIKVETEATFQGNLIATWNLFDSQSKHSTRATLRLGGGIELALTPKLHLRADYCFTDYQRVNLNGAITTTNSVLAGDIFLNHSTTFHLIDHSFLLGISYYFH